MFRSIASLVSSITPVNAHAFLGSSQGELNRSGTTVSAAASAIDVPTTRNDRRSRSRSRSRSRTPPPRLRLSDKEEEEQEEKLLKVTETFRWFRQVNPLVYNLLYGKEDEVEETNSSECIKNVLVYYDIAFSTLRTYASIHHVSPENYQDAANKLPSLMCFCPATYMSLNSFNVCQRAKELYKNQVEHRFMEDMKMQPKMVIDFFYLQLLDDKNEYSFSKSLDPSRRIIIRNLIFDTIKSFVQAVESSLVQLLRKEEDEGDTITTHDSLEVHIKRQNLEKLLKVPNLLVKLEKIALTFVTPKYSAYYSNSINEPSNPQIWFLKWLQEFDASITKMLETVTAYGFEGNFKGV